MDEWDGVVRFPPTWSEKRRGAVLDGRDKLRAKGIDVDETTPPESPQEPQEAPEAPSGPTPPDTASPGPQDPATGPSEGEGSDASPAS